MERKLDFETKLKNNTTSANNPEQTNKQTDNGSDKFLKEQHNSQSIRSYKNSSINKFSCAIKLLRLNLRYRFTETKTEDKK